MIRRHLVILTAIAALALLYSHLDDMPAEPFAICTADGQF